MILDTFSIGTDQAELGLGIVAFLCTGIGWTAATVWKLNRRAREQVIHQYNQNRLMEQAAKELSPNHGSSIRDAVDRIEDRQIMLTNDMSVIGDKVADLHSQHRGLTERVDRMMLALFKGKVE